MSLSAGASRSSFLIRCRDRASASDLPSYQTGPAAIHANPTQSEKLGSYSSDGTNEKSRGALHGSGADILARVFPGKRPGKQIRSVGSVFRNIFEKDRSKW